MNDIKTRYARLQDSADIAMAEEREQEARLLRARVKTRRAQLAITRLVNEAMDDRYGTQAPDKPKGAN